MFAIIIAGALAAVLTPYSAVLHRRASYRIFQWLVHGLGAVPGSGGTHHGRGPGVGGRGAVRHISVFHRFFARAHWSLDALGQGQGLFELALAVGAGGAAAATCWAMIRWRARRARV